MSDKPDSTTRKRLLYDFFHLNTYLDEPYTKEYLQSLIDLILHSIFNALEKRIVTLPLKNQHALMLNSYTTKVSQYFIDAYAYELWPARAQKAGQVDFEASMHCFIGNLVRNVFWLETNLYAGRDAPVNLVEQLRVPEKDELVENWTEGLPEAKRFSKTSEAPELQWVPALREARSDSDLLQAGEKCERLNRCEAMKIVDGGANVGWKQELLDENEEWFCKLTTRNQADAASSRDVS